jgi:radical SAM protein with 4Fe4S-binding SPASM domain
MAAAKVIAEIKRILRKYPRLYRSARAAYPVMTFVAAAARGRRGAGNHLLSTASMLRQSPHVLGRPVNITIEPTNLCNLECPVCETGAGILHRKGEHMSLEQFKVIVDKVAPHTNTLMFYFMGEPFINKQAYAMIRYAKSAGIPFVTTCTNGDAVNPEKLVESGLDEVSFQIGGMTQATHETYRVNSNLERVVKNLRETIRLKKERGSRLHISVGFILMKHNEHEFEAFKQFAREIGADDGNIIDACVRTMEQGQKYLTKDTTNWYYDAESFRRGLLRPKVLPKNECPWIYYSMAIYVNGDVVPCCRDTTGQNIMGNLLTQELGEVWNGEPFRKFRTQLHTNQGQIGICRLCSGYDISKLQ